MKPAGRKPDAKVIDKDSELDASLDDYEPTREEILANIRRGMKQALSGQTRPAREALAEIRREIGADADMG